MTRFNDRPGDFVGQEVVRLSTTPTLRDGQLEPAPFVLRVYAAATPDGIRIMPGGFCRTSDRADVRAISMGEDARTADVWVLADKPVERVTLMSNKEDVKVRRLMGAFAEPGGGQPVLVGALSGAGRGHASVGAQPLHQPDGLRSGHSRQRARPWAGFRNCSTIGVR